MAIIDKMPADDIVDSCRGVLDFYCWRGLTVVRSWPQPPLAPLNPNVIGKWEGFRRVNQAYRYLQNDIVRALRYWATPGHLTPKDLWNIHAYRGFHLLKGHPICLTSWQVTHLAPGWQVDLATDWPCIIATFGAYDEPWLYHETRYRRSKIRAQWAVPWTDRVPLLGPALPYTTNHRLILPEEPAASCRWIQHQFWPEPPLEWGAFSPVLPFPSWELMRDPPPGA